MLYKRLAYKNASLFFTKNKTELKMKKNILKLLALTTLFSITFSSCVLLPIILPPQEEENKLPPEPPIVPITISGSQRGLTTEKGLSIMGDTTYLMLCHDSDNHFYVQLYYIYEDCGLIIKCKDKKEAYELADHLTEVYAYYLSLVTTSENRTYPDEDSQALSNQLGTFGPALPGAYFSRIDHFASYLYNTDKRGNGDTFVNFSDIKPYIELIETGKTREVVEEHGENIYALNSLSIDTAKEELFILPKNFRKKIEPVYINLTNFFIEN